MSKAKHRARVSTRLASVKILPKPNIVIFIQFSANLVFDVYIWQQNFGEKIFPSSTISETFRHKKKFKTCLIMLGSNRQYSCVLFKANKFIRKTKSSEAMKRADLARLNLQVLSGKILIRDGFKIYVNT
jgi:hypothetical protein